MARAPGAPACEGNPKPLRAQERSPVRHTLREPIPGGSEIVVGLPDSERWRVTGNDVRFLDWPDYRRSYLLGIAGFIGFGLAALVASKRSRRS